MDLTSLRYFVAVAETESVARAAEDVPISPGSLTKAVQRLEAELGVKLFERVGRRIRRTEAGTRLLEEARSLLRHEEEARARVGGDDQARRLVVSGEEALLGSFAPGWMAQVLARWPKTRFELQSSSPEEVVERLRRGEIHVGFTTRPGPAACRSQRLAEVHFVTCVAPPHPLAGGPRRRRVAISRLLEHPFVVPRRPFLGATEDLQAHDGWRDDAFPRQVRVRADTLHQLLAVVTQGLAVAYLPDALARALGLKVLTVTGCDYQCVQPVNLVVYPPAAPAWLRDLLDG